MYAQPSLVINGASIRDVFSDDYDGPIALADVTITWGRDSFLDGHQPAGMQLVVMDSSGDFGTQDNLIGSEIVLETTLGGAHFRGTISDADMTLIEVTNSRGVRVPYYETKLTCIDHAGTLDAAKSAAPGPTPGFQHRADGMAVRSNMGDYRWDNTSPGGRQNQIKEIAPRVVPGIDTGSFGYPLPYLNPDVQHVHFFHWQDEQISPWEAYDMLVAVWPLASPYYEPWAHRVSYVRPAPDPRIRTARVGGVASLTVENVTDNYGAEEYAVRLVPSEVLQWPDGEATLKSTVTEAIDSVRVSVPRYTSWDNGGSAAVEGNLTAYYDRAVPGRPSTGLRVFEYSSELYERFTSAPARQFGNILAARLATIISGYNGKWRLPSVRFQPDAIDYPNLDSAVKANLIRAYPNQVIWYFVGSQINTLKNVGVAFQIVGGVLTWDPDIGWTHDIRFHPTWGAVPAALTIDQLFGASTVRLDQLNVTLNDLHRVRETIA